MDKDEGLDSLLQIGARILPDVYRADTYLGRRIVSARLYSMGVWGSGVGW